MDDVVGLVLEVGDELGGRVSADVQFICDFATVWGEHLGCYFHLFRGQRIVVVEVVEVFWVLEINFEDITLFTVILYSFNIEVGNLFL